LYSISDKKLVNYNKEIQKILKENISSLNDVLTSNLENDLKVLAVRTCAKVCSINDLDEITLLKTVGIILETIKSNLAFESLCALKLILSKKPNSN